MCSTEVGHSKESTVIGHGSPHFVASPPQSPSHNDPQHARTSASSEKGPRLVAGMERRVTSQGEDMEVQSPEVIQPLSGETTALSEDLLIGNQGGIMRRTKSGGGESGLRKRNSENRGENEGGGGGFFGANFRKRTAELLVPPTKIGAEPTVVQSLKALALSSSE